MALEADGSLQDADAVLDRKMSVIDSIRFYYRRAMQSNQIELLEAYIAKYSSRRYRYRKRYTKLDSAKAALHSLQLLVKKQVTFNKEYPRFGNGAFEDFPILTKGLNGLNKQLFQKIWHDLYQDVVKLPSVRLPSSLTVDYTSQPPAITLNAVIAPQYDVIKTNVGSGNNYHINCLLPVMELLQRLKMLVVAALLEKGSVNAQRSDLVEYQIKKINKAVYIVHLSKPHKKGTLLFYAKDKTNSSIPTDESIQFYNFYDISVEDKKTTRFPIYEGSLPNLIPSLSSDASELQLGTAFFEH
jgi:hypothetical protein